VISPDGVKIVNGTTYPHAQAVARIAQVGYPPRFRRKSQSHRPNITKETLILGAEDFMQLRRHTGWVVWVSMALTLSCCNPQPEEFSTHDKEYFPLRTGMFWEYAVDSTVFFQNVAVRFQYRLEVFITDSVADARGQVWYRMTRVRKEGASAPRSLVTWSARVSAHHVLVREGNIAFVRLVFPATAGRSWNGNAFNALGGAEFCEGVGACDRYTFASHGAVQVLDRLYPDAWEVEEANTADRLVKFDVRFSRYARGVGLVERQYSVLNYCTLPACFGQQFIENGLTYSQQLVAHGIR
jgi:hypothetical protein